MKYLLMILTLAGMLITTTLASSIHDAAESGDLSIVQTLINTGIDVNQKNEDGWTPLHIAASKNHREIVELLIDNGADINSTGNPSFIFTWQGGFTPLHYATVNGHKEIVVLLINKGADVNAKDNSGSTPLDRATQGNHTDIADLLRAQGGNTGTIHVVARNGYLAGVQAYLDAGVDINARDQNGSTPLHWAALEGHKEIAKLLINKGANVNAKDELGDTPLDFAKIEIAQILILNGGKTGMELALMPHLIYEKGKLVIEGWEGLKYKVLYSSNLQNWQILDTITLKTSRHIYIDKNPTKESKRFYKLRLIE